MTKRDEGEPIEICLGERPHDWTAFVGGEQLMQEQGPSPCAAIGALVLQNPERFGVTIRWLTGHTVPEPGASEAAPDPKPIWSDRLRFLRFGSNVPEESPVIRGTWITVAHVVSLIVDGWTWADIFRAHPELSEADIRACLAYTLDAEQSVES